MDKAPLTANNAHANLEPEVSFPSRRRTGSKGSFPKNPPLKARHAADRGEDPTEQANKERVLDPVAPAATFLSASFRNVKSN